MQPSGNVGETRAGMLCAATHLDQADAAELLQNDEGMDGRVLNLSGRLNLLVDQRRALTG